MTQTKLKIYQELFDEVIARDKVFGGLLRKIKGAYENYFEGAECERTHGGESQQGAPGIVRGMRTGAQTPVEDSGSLEGRVHDLHQLGQSEGAESNAGTERQKSGNEALAAEERTQDLEKENRALRGLIARLHSERNQARQALALCEAKQQQGPTTSKFDHEGRGFPQAWCCPKFPHPWLWRSAQRRRTAAADLCRRQRRTRQSCGPSSPWL